MKNSFLTPLFGAVVTSAYTWAAAKVTTDIFLSPATLQASIMSTADTMTAGAFSLVLIVAAITSAALTAKATNDYIKANPNLFPK